MRHRRVLLSLLAVVTLATGGCTAASDASPKSSGTTSMTTAVPATGRPLFINMTTDDSHRANMALSFGQKQQALGHPLTVFLNDKGVFVGSTDNAAKYEMHQKMISAIIAAGGTVLACPMCTEHYGVNPATYVKGVKMGNPELTGGKLFEDGSISLTW